MSCVNRTLMFNAGNSPRTPEKQIPKSGMQCPASLDSPGNRARVAELFASLSSPHSPESSGSKPLHGQQNLLSSPSQKKTKEAVSSTFLSFLMPHNLDAEEKSSPRKNKDLFDNYQNNRPPALKRTSIQRAENHSDPNDPISKFINNAMKILKKGLILGPHCIYATSPILGASGDHSQMYDVEGSFPLIPNYSNNQILLRVYQKEQYQRINHIREMLKQQYENYLELQLAGLPTVPLLNIETMMIDGYLAVPKIAHPYLTDRKEKLIPVRQFLETCYIYDIPADAHHGTSKKGYKDTNFRSLTPNGPPILCDFMEITEDEGFANSEKFAVRLNGHLESWSRRDRKISDFLDPRILQIEWNAQTNLKGLTAENITSLIQQIKNIKYRYLEHLKQFPLQTAKRSREFKNEILNLHQNSGLGELSLSTLKNLILTKATLNESFLKMKVQMYGSVETIEELIRNPSNDNGVPTREDAIEFLSAGNPFVREFLSPL
ncbi:MAG: hypothetical protein V4487_05140 [Chlamydiota bacterium]